MSLLRESLFRIQNWLEKHYSSSLSLLQPGLSDSEIDNIVKSIPIQLPVEIYELYKWRNGCGDGSRTWEFAGIFEQWGFVPLEYAVAEYRHTIEEDERRHPTNRNPNSLNIFFSNEICDEGYILIDKNQNVSLVDFGYWDDGIWNPLISYTNLTSMMLIIAESYETAYYINENGHLIPDCNKTNQIWRKYNFSGLP